MEEEEEETDQGMDSNEDDGSRIRTIRRTWNVWRCPRSAIQEVGEERLGIRVTTDNGIEDKVSNSKLPDNNVVEEIH
jgi:hypothetical protein